MKSNDENDEKNDYENLKISVFKQALQYRNILINDEIDESLIEKAWFQMEKLYAENQEAPIILTINSNGGNLDETLMLCDYMRTLPTTIITYCLGKCVSAGFLLFVSGNYRVCYNSSVLMAHELYHYYNGKSIEIQSTAKFIREQQKQIIQLLSEQSKLTNEECEEYLKNESEWYMTSSTAKKFGFVDRIIKPKQTFKTKEDWLTKDKQKEIDQIIKLF